MNKLMVYSALAVALMAGEPCLVPIYAQDKAMQAMTLTALYNLADQQSQKVRRVRWLCRQPAKGWQQPNRLCCPVWI